MKKSNRDVINNEVKANIAAYRKGQAHAIERLRHYVSINNGSKQHAFLIQHYRFQIAAAQWKIANASDNVSFRSEAFALYNRARAGRVNAKKALNQFYINNVKGA